MKNPPFNAGVTGSITGPGIKSPSASGRLNLLGATTKPSTAEINK